MNSIDSALQANHEYASRFALAHLEPAPTQRMAVVTCMDARLDVYGMLGLEPGAANIIRNAGAVVTNDVLRSLIVAHHLLGVQEVMVIGHTGCGMQVHSNESWFDWLRGKTGASATEPTAFHTFQDLEQHVREQAHGIANHPWLRDRVIVRGFVYQVEDGRLSPVPDHSAS